MPLTLAELPKAIQSVPIGLIEQAGGGFLPVALLSLQPNKNLFVTADGRWIQAYIPASCRAYPFILAKTKDGQQVLCIDEDSGLVVDGTDGEAFFQEDGQVAPTLQEVLNFLHQTEQSRNATAAACALLKQYDLISPWPITVKADGEDKMISGIFQINEAALNKLSADELAKIRDSGALVLAYCQMLSMQHLPVLGQLADAHAKAAAQAAATATSVTKKGEMNLEFLKKNTSIDFSGFR